jgi:tRNA(adenine34) deaminase
MMSTDHEYYMGLALLQARRAAKLQEVPVGAVVVCQGRVVSQAFNRRELEQDPTAHAEILALRQAAAATQSWRLTEATLYVTLEPCPMCAGAIVLARVEHLVYGCDDPKTGAVRSLYALCSDDRLNHRPEITSGVRREECAALLKAFFAGLRAAGEK